MMELHLSNDGKSIRVMAPNGAAILIPARQDQLHRLLDLLRTEGKEREAAARMRAHVPRGAGRPSRLDTHGQPTLADLVRVCACGSGAERATSVDRCADCPGWEGQGKVPAITRLTARGRVADYTGPVIDPFA